MAGINPGRRRIGEILDVGQPDDRTSRIVDMVLVAVILLNVVAVILESVPRFADAWAAEFAVFDAVSVGVFSVEYALRVWSAVDSTDPRYRHPAWGRIRFMLSPLAMIDLLAILPFYLGFVVDLDLRFLRALRLLRVFKLTRYSSSMTMLLGVLRDEARAIGAALFVLSMLIVLASGLVYLAEHRAQPDVFGSIPEAMWWAVVTMTTVGYGDVVPVTVAGKVLGACIGVIGVGMVALPAGLLASGFSEQLHRRRKEFAGAVEAAVADGELTAEEEEQLRRIREELGLSAEAADEIRDTVFGRRLRHVGLCPHCGKPLPGRRSSDGRGP